MGASEGTLERKKLGGKKKREGRTLFVRGIILSRGRQRGVCRSVEKLIGLQENPKRA